MGEPSQKNKSKLSNVAIIMDGNGRWAKANKLQITQGHEKGVGVVKEIVEECVRQEVKSPVSYTHLTLPTKA